MTNKSPEQHHDMSTAIQAVGARGEIAVSESTARAIAEVQARITVARRFPRDMDDVRIALLKDCKRPAFAEVARYWLPARGTGEDSKPLEGWTIRFAEAAIRYLTNLDVVVSVVFDDEERQVVDVIIVDLETNNKTSQAISIRKVKERKFLGKGQVAISQRPAPGGGTLFLVPESPDGIRTLVANQVSKVKRGLVLALVPGDTLDDCLREWHATIKQIEAKDAKDPDEARKRLLEGFATVGVRAVDLVEYFAGRPVDQFGPAELKEARVLYSVLKGAELTWPDALAASPHLAKSEGGDDKPEDKKAKEARDTLKRKGEEMEAAAKKAAEAKKAKAGEAPKDAPATSSAPAATATAKDAAKAAPVATDTPAGEPPPGALKEEQAGAKPTREPGID